MFVRSLDPLWFVEAKQALSIAGPICSHANELIVTSRTQIEKAAVLWAQTAFMAKAIQQQFNVLEQVRNMLRSLQRSSEDEYRSRLVNLEAMDKRLNQALETLENTSLDLAFSAQPRNLKSFVHEEGILQLRHSVAALSSQAKETEQKLSASISKLEGDILQLQRKVKPLKPRKRESLERAHECTDSIALDARNMASMLESLTQHYDLCSTASQMARAAQAGDRESEESLDAVVKVLEEDAGEIEEVIGDLYDRRDAIEESEHFVSSFLSETVEAWNEVSSVFEIFDNFSKTELTEYSQELNSFSQNHTLSIEEIEKLMGEIESLVKYYEIFLQSYYAMVLEVLRRKRAQESLSNMVKTMSETLSDAFKKEEEARQKFVKERGDYLPSDLWEGLTETLSEPQIVVPNSVLPDPSKSTIGRALKEL